ncbi:hypothetical protein CVT24_009799 [Panaeolus cyanescens]|uniref:Uncharacterized protein n=1 Tax=Panaeolus cyanescens TaxID=181874 RepID=A0A409VAB4_9AGAR|nr:hypothetical protein CVT24_009799 [Panaeolus cyanescens]
MDALSSEWRKDSLYNVGDRVAFKLSDSLGVAAFECLVTPLMSTNPSQEATTTGNTTPEGFPEDPNTTSMKPTSIQLNSYPHHHPP